MKQIKFNHDTDDLHGSMGTTLDDFAGDVARCIVQYMEEASDDISKQTLSYIGETMVKKMKPEHILILAIKEISTAMDSWLDYEVGKIPTKTIKYDA
jgi:hypothetical protein